MCRWAGATEAYCSESLAITATYPRAGYYGSSRRSAFADFAAMLPISVGFVGTIDGELQPADDFPELDLRRIARRAWGISLKSALYAPSARPT